MVKSRVKYIQSLTLKKQRDSEGVFVAEGPKIINELLSSGRVRAREIYALKDWKPDHEASASWELITVDESDLQRISSLSTPNMVLGIFEKPILPPLQLTNMISLAADGIQDPGNLGTMIRCADWFGIPQIVCSRDCADAFGPKALQASMGSIARVHVYYMDLPAALKTDAVEIVAATLGGEDVFAFDPLRDGVLLIGSEGRGIRENVLQLAHRQVTIPRRGSAESLNAGVATGILLSQLVR